MENPELYASFPYPLFAIGKPDFARLQNTYDRSVHKSAAGWQNADVYAARAGKMQTAKELLVKRAKQVNPDHRFPAFWGPNYDWTPDQITAAILLSLCRKCCCRLTAISSSYFPPGRPIGMSSSNCLRRNRP
jgi:hypothetical protein